MHFAHPEMFWLFGVLIIFFLGFILHLNKRKRLLEDFALRENLSRISKSVSMDRKIFKFIFLILSMTFLVLAASGPQWGKELQELSREGIDIIIALDTSKSMMAQDIQPNRLARAGRQISAFLDRLKGDRVGLIFFAGASFVQCPLTLDYGAIKLYLELADPSVIPIPGTDIAGALDKAVEAFEISGKRGRVIILMTDGETHTENTIEAANRAHDSGVIVYSVGFGRGRGVPIPIRNDSGNVTGYQKDDEGKPVLSSLNMQILSEISSITGGEYFQVSGEEGELDKIAEEIDKMEKAKFKGKKGTKYKDRYQYPLAPALLFLLGYLLITDRKKGY